MRRSLGEEVRRRGGRFCLSFLLFLSVSCFTASTVFAVMENSGRPFSPLGSAFSGKEDTLQQIFDVLTTLPGGGALDAVNDQISTALFTLVGDNQKGYRLSTNRGHSGKLGIYNPSGTEVDLDIGSDHKFDFGVNSSNELEVNGVAAAAGFGKTVGFYWHNTRQDRFAYTEDDKNFANEVRVLAYRPPVGTLVKTIAMGWIETIDNTLILAFEDLSPTRSNGDNDFQDDIWMVELGVVPEIPAGAAIPVIALIGLGVFFIRKRSARVST